MAGRTTGKRKGSETTTGAAAPPPPPPLAPVPARPSRADRVRADTRLQEIDEVCSAWAAIVAERMSADQTFAELVEQYQHGTRDLRTLFLWDALQAAEAHVALVNAVIARHLDGSRRADPLAILADLRAEQDKTAAVYAVNAFLAVLNQMSSKKPKWLTNDELDPRVAVLALAHQTLCYALEAARVSAPADLTEHVIRATQDDTVWVWRKMPEPGTDTLAACAAAAAFFRDLGATRLTTTDEVAALYAEHASARAA